MYSSEAFDDEAIAAGQPLSGRDRKLAGLRPFKKGENGSNHAGAPITVREAKAISRNKSAAAMNILVSLMTADDDKIKLVACLAILDRGLGKVRELPDEPPPRPVIDATQFSDAELDMMNKALAKALGEDGAQIDDALADDSDQVVMSPADQGEAGLGGAVPMEPGEEDGGPIIEASGTSVTVQPAGPVVFPWRKSK